MGSSCWRHYRTAHFTGDLGCGFPHDGSVHRVLPFVPKHLHPTGKDVDRADHIGVFLEAAFHTLELGLRLAIIRRHVAAGRAGAAGVLRRNGNEVSAVPLEFVVQLATELEPALVEDGLVQAGLGPNILARRLGCACRRPGHVPNP